MGVSGGSYGKIGLPKTSVKKAERPSWLFYFKKKEMRFFQNNHDMEIWICFLAENMNLFFPEDMDLLFS